MRRTTRGILTWRPYHSILVVRPTHGNPLLCPPLPAISPFYAPPQRYPLPGVPPHEIPFVSPFEASPRGIPTQRSSIADCLPGAASASPSNFTRPLPTCAFPACPFPLKAPPPLTHPPPADNPNPPIPCSPSLRAHLPRPSHPFRPYPLQASNCCPQPSSSARPPPPRLSGSVPPTGIGGLSALVSGLTPVGG
jgi:hypothetical protein